MNRLARFAGFGSGEEQGVVDRDDADLMTTDSGDVVVEQMSAEDLREPIIAALRQVHDPEIPVNIYDLGLIYTIDIADTGDVAIDMTLTAPACPVAGMMPVMVKDAVQKVEGVGDVAVELVWDPPWSQANMSEEALLTLGML
jgi:FeS assembly SUF system protein